MTDELDLVLNRQIPLSCEVLEEFTLRLLGVSRIAGDGVSARVQGIVPSNGRRAVPRDALQLTACSWWIQNMKRRNLVIWFRHGEAPAATRPEHEPDSPTREIT